MKQMKNCVPTKSKLGRMYKYRDVGTYTDVRTGLDKVLGKIMSEYSSGNQTHSDV